MLKKILFASALLSSSLSGNVIANNDTCENALLKKIPISSPEGVLQMPEIQALIQYGMVLANNPDISLEIVGTTDQDGTEMYNLGRAEMWLAQAKRHLLTAGANEEQLILLSVGESYILSGQMPPENALLPELKKASGERVELDCLII